MTVADTSSSCCFTPRGAWDQLTIYDPLDLVTHDGTSYIALTTNIGTEPTFFAATWMVLAEKGDPFQFNLRGPWSRTTLYHRFDVVSFAGSSWVARRDNIGTEPAESADWMLLAQRGPSTVAGSFFSGGGGGGSISIKESGVVVVAAATDLDFGSGFDVTEAPAGEANVSLDASEVSAAPVSSEPGDAQITGADPTFANSSHQHAREAFATVAELADVAAAESAGTSPTVPRGDHVHAHGSGYLPDAHHAQAHDQTDHDRAEAGDIAAVAVAGLAGTSVEVPNADHVHPHGSGYPGGHTDSASATTIEEQGAVVVAAADTLDFQAGFDITESPAGTASIALDASEVSAAPTGDVDIGDAAVAGAAATFANSAHQHAFPAPGAGYPVDADFNVEADGVATTPARSDHRHAIPAPASGYPVDVAATEADGTGTSPARADHRHAHGSGYLPDAHHNQSHSDTDHTAGFAAPIGNIDLGDTNAAGAAATHARSDHEHAFAAPAAGYPVDVAAAEADGVLTTVPRADHVHAHGSGYLPNAHHNQAHSIIGADHTSFPGGTTTFLRADGTFATPAGGGGTVSFATIVKFGRGG